MKMEDHTRQVIANAVETFTAGLGSKIYPEL